MTEQRDRARERLVRVAVAENPTTASMIRETLTGAGIQSMLKNRDATSVIWGTAGTPWSVEVWVLEGDAEAAAAVLGGTPAPPLPPPAVEPHHKRRWWQVFDRRPR